MSSAPTRLHVHRGKEYRLTCAVPEADGYAWFIEDDIDALVADTRKAILSLIDASDAESVTQ